MGVITLVLPQPNATDYTFDVPLIEARERALAALDVKSQVERRIFGPPPPNALGYEDVLAVETMDNAVFAKTLAKDIFDSAENAKDIFLHAFHSPFWNSPIYRGRDGNGLPFLAEFHVHLREAAPAKTSFSVRARKTEVWNGQYLGFGHSILPGWIPRIESVKPTTVEEYMILRYVGEALGVRDMPPVKLPAAR